MRMPSARNWCRVASVASLSCSSTVSVISISSRVGCRPDAASALTMTGIRLEPRNCAAEILTATLRWSGQRLLVHRGLEEAERTAAVALGAVQREIGVSQQLVGRIAIARADGNADAGADQGLLAVDVIGLADPGDDLLRQRGCFRRIRNRRLHDDEFVAAHPRDGVALAHQPAQTIGDDLQQLVAGRMPKRVVDGLELIEV